jgi:hypothetical protein
MITATIGLPAASAAKLTKVVHAIPTTDQKCKARAAAANAATQITLAATASTNQ